MYMLHVLVGKLLYNMTHVFRSYQQTSHFIPFGQLFILHKVLQDINTVHVVIYFCNK